MALTFWSPEFFSPGDGFFKEDSRICESIAGHTFDIVYQAGTNDSIKIPLTHEEAITINSRRYSRFLCSEFESGLYLISVSVSETGELGCAYFIDTVSGAASRVSSGKEIRLQTGYLTNMQDSEQNGIAQSQEPMKHNREFFFRGTAIKWSSGLADVVFKYDNDIVTIFPNEDRMQLGIVSRRFVSLGLRDNLIGLFLRVIIDGEPLIITSISSTVSLVMDGALIRENDIKSINATGKIISG